MEKNKKILIAALRKLPVYQPEDEVWEKVERRLENTPLNLFAQLPQFEAPESIWKNIDAELSYREKIAALPTYTPTDVVWDNIDRNLTFRKTNRNRNQIVSWAKWLSAAAAIFFIGYFILMAVNKSDNEFTYSEEWIESIDSIEWNEDNQSVEYALNLLCEENPIACKTTEFMEMKKELSFLNQSKQAILQQLNKYDSNTNLEIMLTEIELERSNLIKEMIAKTTI